MGEEHHQPHNGRQKNRHAIIGDWLPSDSKHDAAQQLCPHRNMHTVHIGGRNMLALRALFSLFKSGACVAKYRSVYIDEMEN